MVLQLAGRTAQPIVELARAQLAHGIVALNINAGCPQNFALDKGEEGVFVFVLSVKDTVVDCGRIQRI